MVSFTGISRANLHIKTNTSSEISQRLRDGAISNVVCTEMNESSRAVLECALPCECRIKKTVNLYKRGFQIYDLLVALYYILFLPHS